MLDYTDRDERDWLELKAACYPEGGVFAGRDNEADYAWNVAKAVVALANSLGGVVLLGVADDGQIVGLEASDPKSLLRQGMDAYLRNYFNPRVLFPRRGWLLGKGNQFKLSAGGLSLLTQLVSVERLFSQGKSVLAIVVEPVPAEFAPLITDEFAPGGKKLGQRVFVRKLGHLGEVDTLYADDAVSIGLHQDQRKVRMAEVADLYKGFVHDAALISPSEQRDSQINDYLHRVLDELAHLETGYAPIDAYLLSSTSRKNARVEKRSDEDWLRAPLAAKPEHGTPAACDASALLNRHTRIHLSGSAGSGKSTSLRKIALRLARTRNSASSASGPWPVLLQLSEYDEGGLAALASDATSMLWSDLAVLIRSGEVVLLLDGLNECPMELHQHCCVELASLLQEFPDAKVIVTDRSDLSNTPLQGMLNQYRMSALNARQGKAFLASYLPASADVDGLMRGIEAQPNLSRFARNPVLLRVMAELLKDGCELPQQRHELFGLMFDNWFRREEIQSQGTRFGHQTTVDALASLAFWMKKNARSSLRQDEARRVLQPLLGEEVEAFIVWLSSDVILARSAHGQGLVFWHALMQDYFCAVYFKRRGEWFSDNLVTGSSLPAPGFWLHASAFTFEMLPHPAKALARAFLQADPLMTALMLQDDSLLDDEAVGAVAQSHGHWVACTVATLQDRPVSGLLEHLLIETHLPPKYPITRQLTEVLRSELFWASAEMYRPDRLRRLEDAILSGEFPWTELQQEALEGHPALVEQQSTALRLLAGDRQAGILGKEEIKALSPSGLCALRRKKHLSFDVFFAALKQQLLHLSDDALQLALVDAVRSEKDEANALVSYLASRYKRQLQRLALDERLSVRVLSILLRNRVFSRSEFRDIPGKVAEVCVRSSLMNIIRLGQIGLIERSDLSDDDVARLVFDTSAGSRHQDYMKQCVELDLLTKDDVPEKIYQRFAHKLVRRKGHTLYRERDLISASTRSQLTASLYGQSFVIKLKNYLSSKSIGFARHPDFDADIFVPGRAILHDQGGDLRSGDRLEVQIAPSFDRMKERWTFSVQSGRLLHG